MCVCVCVYVCMRETYIHSPSCHLHLRYVLSYTRKLDFLRFIPNFLYFSSGATLQPHKKRKHT